MAHNEQSIAVIERGKLRCGAWCARELVKQIRGAKGLARCQSVTRNTKQSSDCLRLMRPSSVKSAISVQANSDPTPGINRRRAGFSGAIGYGGLRKGSA